MENITTVKPPIVDTLIEIATQYNKPLNKGHSQGPNNWFPIVLIHFEPPRRGQPLYKGQSSIIYIGPKVSFVQRFNCIHLLVCILIFLLNVLDNQSRIIISIFHSDPAVRSGHLILESMTSRRLFPAK